MDILEKLNWRYAVKKFDPSKKLNEAQLERVLEATRLSASSYGLQPYKVIVVKDPAVREALKAVSWNQPQITDASHLVVFARFDDLNDGHVDTFMGHVAGARNLQLDDLKGYENILKGTVNRLSEDAAAIWTSKQAYLALGTLLTASAVEGIDACPMEGFDAAAYDEVLGLKEKNLRTVVVAAIGFRAEEDTMQHAKKVRKPLEDFVELV